MCVGYLVAQEGPVVVDIASLSFQPRVGTSVLAVSSRLQPSVGGIAQGAIALANEAAVK